MDHKEEYHDPDYVGVSVEVKEEPIVQSDEDKADKIRTIIRREFSNELEIRENEVMLIEQRMTTSRRMLHRLRYALVSRYYCDQKLQATCSQVEEQSSHDPRLRAEMSTLMREGQRGLHPSVRKLLGRKTVELHEIFKHREPRKARRDYSAMLQTRNYTIAADETKSLRPDRVEGEAPEVGGGGASGGGDEASGDRGGASSGGGGASKPKRVPRHIEPTTGAMITIDEVTRNKVKHRYRIIIGNTSKYAPAASRADRSTHKWLLYVRGPPGRPGAARVLSHVVARLHHSYAPHHTVHVYNPPFHISRRGWGEFPAKIELHFPLPEVNRPAVVQHTIKLDRNYTGMQILGAETIVDAWLYSTPEMLEYEYVDPVPTPLADPKTTEDTHMETQPEETEIQPKAEPIEYDSINENHESWMDFFSKDSTELDVDEMIIKPIKKEDIEEKNDVESLINATVINRDEEVIVKTEPDWTDDKVDVPEEILNQPTTPKKRIMKYIDSNTGKIYYLEMDRTLDLSKVQEIVINNTKTAKISPIKNNGLKNFRKKKGESLLKPEVKNQLKIESKTEKLSFSRIFAHIENDHCYLGNNWMLNSKRTENVLSDNELSVASEVKSEKSLLDSLCSSLSAFTCVKVAVNYLLKKIPVICDMARDPDFVRNFPFVVESDERFWKLDFAKRRNIEWSRAKLINKMLTEHFTHTDPIWRTKQILIYSRLHGHHPIRPDTTFKQPETDDWSSWNDLENSRKMESNIKELYPEAADICSLTVFNNDFVNNSYESIELTDSDEDVEIVSSELPVKVKSEVLPAVNSDSLTVLPVESEEDRLRFMFIEKKCADIGIELRNEDIGNGYSYSAVHAVLLSAMKSFAEDMLRGSLAARLRENTRHEAIPPVWISCPWGTSLQVEHAWRAARGGRRGVLARQGLASRGGAPATRDKL